MMLYKEAEGEIKNKINKYMTLFKCQSIYSLRHRRTITPGYSPSVRQAKYLVL